MLSSLPIAQTFQFWITLKMVIRGTSDRGTLDRGTLVRGTLVRGTLDYVNVEKFFYNKNYFMIRDNLDI